MICFARRGSNPRTNALDQALLTAQKRFCDQHNITNHALINVVPDYAYNRTGLQAVDYFLWALQRQFEKGERRFLDYLWQKVGLIQDVDNKKNNHYGEYYTKKNVIPDDFLVNR